MHVPAHFTMDDRREALTFIRRFSFGLLISAKNNEPEATHLPFVVREENGRIVLASHMAKANPQGKELEKGGALVVFSEPHAYISPRHYEKELNVPTWNYLAVHARGVVRIVREDKDALRVLESMIDSYEADYKLQWEKLPADYKLNMIKGITAFEMEVTDLKGMKKLSQNKTQNERNSIIAAFEQSVAENERVVAEFMKGLKAN